MGAAGAAPVAPMCGWRGPRPGAPHLREVRVSPLSALRQLSWTKTTAAGGDRRLVPCRGSSSGRRLSRFGALAAAGVVAADSAGLAGAGALQGAAAVGAGVAGRWRPRAAEERERTGRWVRSVRGADAEVGLYVARAELR